MPEPLLRRAMAAFGPIFCQIYGMTESGGPGLLLFTRINTFSTVRLTSAGVRLRSAGQPMTGCDVRIVGSDGAFCGCRAF